MNTGFRTRRFLLVLGLVFLAIAAYVMIIPENSPEYAAIISGAIGTGLVVASKFASERIVKLLETLLTGW